MSFKAEETLRKSINDMWDDIIMPHIFNHNDDLSIQGGMYTHILNENITKMKREFYATMMLHHEPTLDAAILDEINDDELDDDDINDTEL